MKVILVIAVVVAGLWVWRHHTTSATSICLPEPVQLCVERPSTATQPR